MEHGTAELPLPGTTRGGRAALHITVVVSGAAVMILELLGTRIIAPFYGASLYVWTALIAVTLAGLGLGYWLGGALANRAHGPGLAHALAAAGLLCAAVPPAAAPVLRATDALGLRAGAFCSAALLFLPPLVALGCIAPLAIQRSATGLQAVGLAAGRVFALSTAGSVAGTVLFGFFLLPTLGSRATLFGLSALLLLLSAFTAWLGRRRRDLPALALVALAGLAIPGALAGREASATDGRVLFDAESVHGRVRVVESRRTGLRWLLADACTLSAAEPGAARPAFPYLQILAATPDLRPRARQALVVGVGGGFLPRDLRARGLHVECIEIDPLVARAAQLWFGYEPEDALRLGDARHVIRGLPRRFDLVLHDCFTGGSVPAHLLSVEALRDLERCMTSDAVLALNFVGHAGPEASPALRCVRASLAAVFSHVAAIVVQPDSPLCDVIFLASDGALDPQALQALALSAACDAPLARVQDITERGGFVLTDDFNPLDVLQVGTSEAYRGMLVARLGLDELAR